MISSRESHPAPAAPNPPNEMETIGLWRRAAACDRDLVIRVRDAGETCDRATARQFSRAAAEEHEISRLIIIIRNFIFLPRPH